ncbi:MAG: DUF1631 family protein [Pseudomonadota bacterium]
MDRNDLLAATRAEYLRGFLFSVDQSVTQSVEALFKKADSSYSALDQGRYLDARGILRDRDTDLRMQMHKSMEQLLNRSLQTTYSTFRPSFFSSFSGNSLSLVDSTAFEGELRIDEITNRFRSEAEEQLRDLNIRIALLFEQDNIKERENPFRPYLLSRSIASAIESMGISGDLAGILITELAENMEPHVAEIYDAVNTHLARNGIAAQLQLKIKKSPIKADNRATLPPAPLPESDPEHFGESQSEQGAHNIQNTPNMQDAPGEPQAASANNPFDIGRMIDDAANSYELNDRETSIDTPKRTVDQLLDLVRGMAGSAPNGEMAGAASGSGNPVGPQQAGGPAGQTAQGSRQHGGYGQASDQSAGQQSNQQGQARSRNQAADHAVGQHAQGGQYANGAQGGAGTYSGAGQQGATQAPANNNPAKNGWLAGKQMVGEVLKKFFSGDGITAGGANGSGFGSGAIASAAATNDTGSNNANQGETGRPGGASTLREATAQLTHSVDRLIQERTPASAEMLADDGEVRNLVLEQRASLNSMTEDVDEQMTIDIVAMLFEFILRDTQVPAEVRAQLGRLQFLVLKIALLDTSLLTQKGHPARLLVNRIGSISLGLKQIDPSGVRVTAEICRIVETLLRDGSRSANLFSKMLDDFDAFIAQELRASDENVERVVQVLEKAQSRTLRFVHATAKMNEALQGLTIDPLLHDFFVNAWVQALERAERTDAGRAKRFRLLVPDLLWSIVPKVQEHDRTQLFALLPIILSTLREGLTFTDWNAEQQQNLLNWLVDAHTSALRSGLALLPVPSLSSTHQHFEKFVDNPEAEPIAGGIGANTPAQDKQFLDEAIKELDIQIQLLDSVFDQEGVLAPEEELAFEAATIMTATKTATAAQSAMPMHSPVLASNESVMERLRSGIAIEINLGGKPSVGRLNWINPNAANMVLTLEQQSTPSMISVRMFRRLYNSGRVSFLESAPLFERAVESLLKTAERIDRKVA